MTSLSPLFYSSVFLLLLNFLTCFSFLVNGYDVANYHVKSVKYLIPKDVCTLSKSKGSQLEIAHRHGPCSPIKPKKKPTKLDILKQDQHRVDWLHSKRTTSASNSMLSSTKIPAQSGNSLGSGNYIVTVGFGTPKVTQSVIFDTGSDVTWIQCQPCVSTCYTQQDPLFNPDQSKTYSNISCPSAYCTTLDASGCSGSTCVYSVRYGDNSSTAGFFAEDTLTLTSEDIIPNFHFGCGLRNKGIFGQVAGLIGLGREQVSLVGQTLQKYGGVFSYCLPASSTSTGFLNFGPNLAPKNATYTPMLSNSTMPSFYFLELISITVGGTGLAISPTLFSNAGTVIDSGTVITRLPPTAYSALRTAFRQGMLKYQITAPSSLFDTCYDFSQYQNQTVGVPSIALNFRGATVNLEVYGIIYFMSSTQGCLSFAPNSDDTDLVIIGNTQQQGLNVVYDVTKKLIGFGPGAC